jgi:hypothetical protein
VERCEWSSAYIGGMTEAKPASIAIYRRGPSWIDGRALRDQPTLLDHGRFLAELEQTGRAVHAGPMYHLDVVAAADPIGIASFPGDVDAARLILRDDPALVSGLLLCDILAWHVADA